MEERPRLSVPRTRIDNLLDALGLVVLVSICVFVGFQYAALPDRIPTHFGLSGVPNSWGSKSMLWVIVVVVTFVHALMLGVSFIKPWYWNIPVRVTSENAPAVYRLTRRLLQVVKLIITLMLGAIVVGVTRVAHAQTATLAHWALWPGLSAIGLALGWYFIAVRRLAPRGA